VGAVRPNNLPAKPILVPGERRIHYHYRGGYFSPENPVNMLGVLIERPGQGKLLEEFQPPGVDLVPVNLRPCIDGVYRQAARAGTRLKHGILRGDVRRPVDDVSIGGRGRKLLQVGLLPRAVLLLGELFSESP
jgi:hypothetical protein